MDNEDSVLLSPDEVKKRREKKPQQTENNVTDKFYNRGGTVAINYETMGRFSIPSTLYFKDYSVNDENDLLLTRREDLLETEISVLNKLKNEDAKCQVEDMLIEEFFETLIGIKKQFDTTQHTHLWICSCQDELPIAEQAVNELVIDLNTIQYKSIIEADEILKDYYREKFKTLSPEAWQEYIITRYKDDPNVSLTELTPEEELKNIRIKEPMQIKTDRLYSFRFPRIGDLVKARKIASKEYNIKIKEVQARKNPNVLLKDLNFQKEEDIKKLEKEEAKYTFLVTRALSLISVDGRELTDSEKIQIFSHLPRTTDAKIKEFLTQFKFGIQHEQEFVCPICGKTDKRLLQREIDPHELLPTFSVTKRDIRQSPGIDIYVGI